jgi:hypothetical protein
MPRRRITQPVAPLLPTVIAPPAPARSSARTRSISTKGPFSAAQTSITVRMSRAAPPIEPSSRW